jgi:hypothetical protein
VRDFILPQRNLQVIQESVRSSPIAELFFILLSYSLGELVNIDVFEASQAVEVALMNKSCTLALKWCADNSSRLTKLKSTLEFKLRMQEFIEVQAWYYSLTPSS